MGETPKTGLLHQDAKYSKRREQIQIKKLGIDEIALVKGQGNYLAVLCNQLVK
jgi:hypothetical protein